MTVDVDVEAANEVRVMLALWEQLRTFDAEERGRMLAWLLSKSQRLHLFELRGQRACSELMRAAEEGDTTVGGS